VSTPRTGERGERSDAVMLGSRTTVVGTFPPTAVAPRRFPNP